MASICILRKALMNNHSDLGRVLDCLLALKYETNEKYTLHASFQPEFPGYSWYFKENAYHKDNHNTSMLENPYHLLQVISGFIFIFFSIS